MYESDGKLGIGPETDEENVQMMLLYYLLVDPGAHLRHHHMVIQVDTGASRRCGGRDGPRLESASLHATC